MDSHIKNLWKQLPFYGETIKLRIKKLTNSKYLSELSIFEKPIKAKIKQLTTMKLLQGQPFYKQAINDDINILRKERRFKRYDETYKVEITNNKHLRGSLFVSKNSIRNLFDKLLREKRSFEYIICVKITRKKRINDNEIDSRTLYFNSLIKTVINRR